MQFIATYNNKTATAIAKIKFPLYSKQKIHLYKNGAREIILDNYLKKHYNTSLKAACILITSSAIISTDCDKDIIYTIRDEKLSKLARLITYGNLDVQGSNILNAAFKI